MSMFISFARGSFALASQAARSAAVFGAAGLGAVGVVACGGSEADNDLRLQLSGTTLTPSTSGTEQPADTTTDATNPPPVSTTPSEPTPPPAAAPAVADPSAPSGPPQECAGPNVASGVYGTPAPADGLLLDFSTYLLPAGSWGDSTVGQLTGGTSLYSGTPAAGITRTLVSGRLQVQATIPVGDYTGLVFWFGPCSNASAFSGIEFSATGSLGGANMIVKPQTSPDYPVDVTNTKGKCPFTAATSKFTECVQPSLSIATLATDSINMPWESFTGGVPSVAVDAAQLLGFELQFQCPAAATAPCALDLSLGRINFTAPTL